MYMGQTTKDHIKAKETDVVCVPCGFTSICEPADVCCNAMFNCKEEKRYAYSKRKSSDCIQARPLSQVGTEWGGVSEDLMRKLLKSYGISVALYGSEDAMIDDKLIEALEAAEPKTRDETTSGESGNDLAANSDEDTDITFPEPASLDTDQKKDNVPRWI